MALHGNDFTEEMLLGDDAPTSPTRTESEMRDLTSRVEQLNSTGGQVPAAVSMERNGTSDLSRLDEWDPHVLMAVAKERIRKEKERGTYVGHRSTFDATTVADNHALSLFFTCPRTRFGQGSVEEQFNCRMDDRVLGSVVPISDPIVASLPFTSIFSLARLLSILENEPDEERRRFLMRRETYVFVTVAGVERAYTFFKDHCDHVRNALLAHDGSSVALSYHGGLDMEMSQLNDLTNAGIRFARDHAWAEVCGRKASAPVLVVLPMGFRNFERVIIPEDDVEVLLYDNLYDVYSNLRARNEIRACVFVSPTSELPFDPEDWVSLATRLAHFVRQGAKLIAVSGPRGDAAWEINRQKTIDACNVIRDSCSAMKSNIVVMLSVVPQLSEPFSVMGDHQKPVPPEAYPVGASRSFLEKLNNVTKSHIGKELWIVRPRPVGRNAVYKQKRLRDAENQWTHPKMSIAKSYQGQRGTGRGRGRGTRGWRRARAF